MEKPAMVAHYQNGNHWNKLSHQIHFHNVSSEYVAWLTGFICLLRVSMYSFAEPLLRLRIWPERSGENRRWSRRWHTDVHLGSDARNGLQYPLNSAGLMPSRFTWPATLLLKLSAAHSTNTGSSISVVRSCCRHRRWIRNLPCVQEYKHRIYLHNMQ